MYYNKHLAVLDLETLGKFSDAVILSLGLTVSKYDDKHLSFQDLKDNGLYIKFNIKEQLNKGRKIDQDVLDFWYKQDVKAKSVLNPSDEDVSLYSVVDIIEEYFKSINLSMKKVDLYDRKSFDIAKLQCICERDLKCDVPWDYRNDYELATAFRFMGYDRYGNLDIRDIPGAMYHHALDDAACDHLRLLKCLHQTLEERSINGQEE